MASHVSKEVTSVRSVSARVGKQILEVVTAGMYNDPRMALREYIQNAADSIDTASRAGALRHTNARIEIEIDGRARSISIYDNGAGISNADADRHLGSLGCSFKEGMAQRGFRGIGRLGGLAYSDLLRFETRASRKENVAVVEWDGRSLRESVGRKKRNESLAQVIRQVATIRFRKATKDDAPHFCRAQMVGVRRFHTDKLMDLRGVREYLSQTAPVPLDDSQFPFAEQVTEHLTAIPGYMAYAIFLNGQQVFRPYAREVRIGEGRSDHITGVELMNFSDSAGRMLGRGWYAKTQYLASFPRHVTMRGIRVRQGNIEVGHEYFLEHIFAERRFATWHIGEIHLCEMIKPNARRDGFEESSEYECFLEQAQSLGRCLSSLCRSSSKQRGALLASTRKLDEVENLLKEVVLVDEEHLEGHVRRIVELLEVLKGRTQSLSHHDGLARRLRKARTALVGLAAHPKYMKECLDGRRLNGVSNRKLLLQVCKAALEEYGRVGSANDLVHRIITPYLKPNVASLLKL